MRVLVIVLLAILLVSLDYDEQISLFYDAEKSPRIEALDKAIEEIRSRYGYNAIKNATLLQNPKAAKKAFDELGVKKLPTVKSLQVEFADLLTAKKEAYAELKKVRDELRDLTVHTANYEELRDLEEREKRKEKEHGRE